jgi:protein-L-isoaspartate O-methyltransferase
MKNSKACTMSYTKDKCGKEMLLKDGKFQVMMEWEKPYMEACIDALQPFGDVLEVGFGCGYSATQIQKFKPHSHTIIECNPIVAEKARLWAAQYPNVHIIEGTWQETFSSLGVFDAIFFDDYPLESPEQIDDLEREGRKSNTLLQEGSRLLQETRKQFPFLEETIYTDADLNELVDHCLKDKQLSFHHLYHFLEELCMRKQISVEQKNRVINCLEQEGIRVIESESLQSCTEQLFDFHGPNERLLTFLQEALNNHMRKGSRFSCFLSSSTSKYLDSKFVDAIICNPCLDYTEKTIQIEVPPNCDYYSGNEALVIVITRPVE